jgi:TolA-binding protein
MDQSNHEQLSDGVANVVQSDDSERPVARIVPIEEGESVQGHRPDGADPEPSIWTRESLLEAHHDGRLSDPFTDGETKIVLGGGGTNPHYGFEDQVPGDRILGQIDRWEYEEGVGPVGYAELADEGIAERIDMGLLEVSADWIRELGDYDEEMGGRPVDHIIGLPRITVLERGAASGASIEITESMAEALAYNPDADPDTDSELTEQMAEVGDAVRWQSDASGSVTVDGDSYRYGVVVDGLQDDDEPDDSLLVAVYEPDGGEWDNRNEQNPVDEERLETVGSDGVGSLPAVSQVTGSEQSAATDTGADTGSLLHRLPDPMLEWLGFNPESVRGESASRTEAQQSDERAESRAGSGVDPDQPIADDSDRDTDTDSTMTNTDDMIEQLSETKARVNTLENETDELEEQLSAKEDRIEELEGAKEQLAEKEDEIDDLEEQLSSLQPVKGVLAEIVADGSMMDAETVAEQHTAGDLIDMISENVEDADDKSPVELVQEQLSAGLEPQGEATPEDETPDELTEEQLAEADDIAYEVITGSDLGKMESEQLSPREYVAEHKGVDPARVSSRDELRRKVEAQGGDA